MADKVVSLQPTTTKQNLISTINTSVVHGIVLIALLGFLIYAVPKYAEVCKQIAIALPAPTILILYISALLNAFWYLVPIIALLALTLNAWIYYSLRNKFISKLPSNIYRGTVLAFMLLCLVVMILSILLPALDYNTVLRVE